MQFLCRDLRQRDEAASHQDPGTRQVTLCRPWCLLSFFVAEALAAILKVPVVEVLYLGVLDSKLTAREAA